MRRLWLMSFGFMMMTGCARATSESPEVIRACTRIGCSSGLAIEVNSTLQQSYTVTLRSGTQVIHTFRCEPGQTCRSFAENQTPADVTVAVQTSAGEVTKAFKPEYVVRRPNGPDCPPDCRQATVTLDLS